jgi:hypothetical protein
VKRGFIKKRVEAGRSVLDRGDVDLLAVDLEVDLPSMNRRSFINMASRLQKLEDEMRLVKHLMELRDPQPLRPDTNTCLGLYSAAQAYLGIEKAGNWTQDLTNKWVEIFERMDEETLSALSKATNNPKAWAPFFDFCSQLVDHCWAEDKKSPSLAWQSLGERLSAARKQLRAVVVTWLELGRGTVSPQFLEGLETNKEALFRRLAKRD